MGAVIVALVLAVPAAAFTFWPFLRQRDRPAPLLPLPSDEREQLTEAKRAALRALRELDFEHAAGHVSDADYAGLRARYEAETADTLRALDALGPAPAVPAPAEGRPTPAPARGWRHPAALGATAVGLLVFGVAIGVGIVRYTEPDRMADTPPAPGSRPLASLDAPSAAAEAPSAANAPRGPVTPQMLQGMLEAARASAEQRGLNNVEFRAFNAEWIDLPVASVDAVLCRWGYMLMADPVAALAESRRVLRPGGRLALAVWDAIAHNPWALLPAQELRERGLVPEPQEGQPGPFALGDRGLVAELLAQAGFAELEVRIVVVDHWTAGYPTARAGTPALGTVITRWRAPAACDPAPRQRPRHPCSERSARPAQT